MVNAKLATLIKTTRVLDAATFAIVLCCAETLLVGVKRPREEDYDDAEKHGCEDQYVFHRSSHVVPPKLANRPHGPLQRMLSIIATS
jgi:hypothetical protein